MKRDYELITVKAFIDRYDVKYKTVDEKEVEKAVEKYLLSVKRNETNAKVVEALLAS